MLGILVILFVVIRHSSRPEMDRPAERQTGTIPARPAPLTPIARQNPGISSDSKRSWTIGETSSGGGNFILALDEVARRDADGKETLAALDPPASDDSLAERISAAGPGAGLTLPVAYQAGELRSAASRRLVTSDLRIHCGGKNPDEIARAVGLSIKDKPAYAPGWLVLSAADPFAALAAMERLRVLGHPTADVLLATQHAKRTMPNDPLISQLWHLKNSSSPRTHSNVESAWLYGGTGGARGSGIRIGIVDDGLETNHEDFTGNIDTTHDWDWNGNDNDPNPAAGDDHGTPCAGNAAARGNNHIGLAGSAPEGVLVGLRLIAGAATDAQEAEAMAWNNDIIEIKSNSWGPDDTGKVLEAPGPLTSAALLNATTTGRGGKGTLLVWAAGNGGDVSDNSNYDGYANSIHTIAIGATDSLGRHATYSEAGANLVVCAPSDGSGNALDITTTDLSGTLGRNVSSSANGGNYANDFGGTSSAAPSAAGIVALILGRNPSLGWRDVQEILIRSAFRIQPADAGWATNSAGLSFHHHFGAGLIDASAAVNLAATWTNLPAQTSQASTQTALSIAIPDNNSTGITRSFDLTGSGILAEHVTLRLSISHTARGNLRITLTSPGGMSSTLADVHPDTFDNYNNWTFSSVRHWGENPAGVWKLKITDLSTSGNNIGGTLTAAELTIHGAENIYANWIAGFQKIPGQSGRLDDPDSDALPNAIENLMGTAPDHPNPGVTDFSKSANTFIFHHPASPAPAADLTFGYEWSDDLIHWNAGGATRDGVSIAFTHETVAHADFPQGWRKVTAAIDGIPAKLFIRIRAE